MTERIEAARSLVHRRRDDVQRAAAASSVSSVIPSGRPQ
jgi:hypothetical protein